MADPLGDRSTHISRLLELALPGHRVQSVERVGEGVDHVAYEVNAELIVLAAILDHYTLHQHSDSFRQRVEFYARSSVFEDVSYGLLPGHEAYLAQARSALHRLF